MDATTLKHAPSIPSLYWSALFKGKEKKSLENKDLSQCLGLAIRLNDNVIETQHLYKFQSFVGLQESNHIPVAYLQLLSFRLQLKLLLDKRLPFPVMGLVHLSSKMDTLKTIHHQKSIDFVSSVESIEHTDKGICTCILTQAYQNDRLVWQSFNDYLYRTPQPKKQPQSGHNNKNGNSEFVKTEANWEVPANLGRRYAALTGDANPIHLCALSAKLFGFKRAIAHGMCMGLLAVYRCTQSENIKSLSLTFKKPVYLPNKVALKANLTDEKSQSFSLLDTNGITKLEGHWHQ
ncbi:hypothetical protein HF888_06760 [Bermanella marisrubri]|uniref:MaoC-like domain-containing protein n=1 Tax=Bermanella marisrubri TaxID=207949 RepID=Q1N5D0_9GAMM|nr:MaoC/PaaZ C-terminal domain-containing protein [Bermanella marisrubri]EAT13172.1 hypothetical protein RED65_00390 [Oceanobacter sp. RED65] [Bermanella marisrubri]QIZ83944.1 hypothetical protein HF888_06760 [Bermanella marisrubri]